MDKKRQCPETWRNTCYENLCPQFNHPSEDPYSEFHKNNQRYQHMDATKSQDYDPKATLDNLSVVDQKIHQIQDLVCQIVDRRAQVSSSSDEQQQHLITSDLTSIIIQLISTAGSLLPSMNKTLFPNHLSGEKLNHRIEEHHCIEEHEMKDEDDPDEGENLCPSSYKILQLEREEILAPHTHFCTICGKGFKRDANLRMHMRGHGDEYKTPEALAKPHKELGSESMLIKRYSCPFVGCKRNKDHNKFQPLKTILCVKNHYKRTHCDKSYTCSRCNKKRFSVIADLKTHEKHCGRDKWLCSCGTTFSRKDKLFGHITLFQGHAPVVPLNEPKGLCENGGKNEVTKEAEFGLDFGSCFSTDDMAQGFADVKGRNVDDSAGFFSPMSFDPCNLECFDEFAQAPFDDSESSLSFLLSGSCSYTPKIGEISDSNVLNNVDEQL